MRPDVALAFDRMERAARADGVTLLISSGFRSDAEQAVLFAPPPGPEVGRAAGHVAAPLRHRARPRPAGRLRLAGARNARALPLHPALPVGALALRLRAQPALDAPAGTGDGGRAADAARVPDFVPERFAPLLARAAQRWNVSAALLAAQLYAESNFNPFAQSPAGAQGIAQFMPGTARALGLDDPFDAAQAIDAQAHLMRDLLRRFASVPLALAAYNAGPAPVAGCMCVPPYPETPRLRRPHPRPARRRRRAGRAAPASPSGWCGEPLTSERAGRATVSPARGL